MANESNLEIELLTLSPRPGRKRHRWLRMEVTGTEIRFADEFWGGTCFSVGRDEEHKIAVVTVVGDDKRPTSP